MADKDTLEVEANFELKDTKFMDQIDKIMSTDLYQKVSRRSKEFVEQTRADMEAFNQRVNQSAVLSSMRIRAAAKRASQENFKDTIEEFKKNFKTLHPIISDFISTISKTFTKTFKSIFNDIKKGVLDAFDPTEGIASYDMGTSLFMNRQARERSMRYGLSAGQTYALTTTMGMLGMNEEDLMWMNAGQKEKFNEMMTKYNAFYDEMQSSGVMQKVQEAQLEVKMLKEDLKNSFLLWIAENKDVIKNTLTAIMEFLKVIATVVGGVFNLMNFSKWGSGSSALSADELNNTYNSSSNNINLTSNVNQTNNISSEADAKDVMDTLSNSNIKRYRQAIEAYK